MDRLTTIYRNPDIMFTELGDKTMTMNIDTGNYHELDAVGAAIWQEIEKPVRLDKLGDRLCSRYDVSSDQCLEDTSAFLAELSELAMVIIANDPSTEA